MSCPSLTIARSGWAGLRRRSETAHLNRPRAPATLNRSLWTICAEPSQQVEQIVDYTAGFLIEVSSAPSKAAAGSRSDASRMSSDCSHAAVYLISHGAPYALPNRAQAPELSCEDYFAPEEWQSVWSLTEGEVLPRSPPPLQEMIVRIARSAATSDEGASLNHRQAPKPSAGMQRMHDLAWAGKPSVQKVVCNNEAVARLTGSQPTETPTARKISARGNAPGFRIQFILRAEGPKHSGSHWRETLTPRRKRRLSRRRSRKPIRLTDVARTRRPTTHRIARRRSGPSSLDVSSAHDAFPPGVRVSARGAGCAPPHRYRRTMGSTPAPKWRLAQSEGVANT